MDTKNIEKICHDVRIDIIKMLKAAGSGHPGGALSAVELLTTLYFDTMRVNPENPKDPDRDRLIVSKGHISVGYYAVLAERGYFPKEELLDYKKPWSKFPGHPDMNKLSGVDMTTGSLGQGLSVANGIAIAGKYDSKDYRVYVLLGDGEIQEGMVWEAAMAAAHYKLDNIIAFVDRNRLQIDGDTETIMALEPLADKWRSFGWHVDEIDGHNVDAIKGAIEQAQAVKGKPSMIIAQTIKGKGVSYMENKVEWHGKAPSNDLCDQALKELGA